MNDIRKPLEGLTIWSEPFDNAGTQRLSFVFKKKPSVADTPRPVHDGHHTDAEALRFVAEQFSRRGDEIMDHAGYTDDDGDLIRRWLLDEADEMEQTND